MVSEILKGKGAKMDQNWYTVELRWLFELSEVQATGSVISERKESDSDPEQFHYAMVTDAQ